jgi:hypothetical protein
MSDLLARVAALAPTTPADPDGLAAARALVEARAAEAPGSLPVHRTSRRVPRVVLTGAAAVVVAATAFAVSTFAPRADQIPDTGPQQVGVGLLPPLPAAAAADSACRAYLLADPMQHGTDVRGAQEVARTPGAADVASWLPGQSPVGLDLTVTSSPCGQAEPAAVFYEPSGAGGVSLYPGVADPWPGYRSPDDVDLRGVQGRTLSPDAGHHFVSWVEPDGVRWFVIGNGMSVADLVAWLDTAPLSGSSVGADASVPGMQRVPDLPPPADGPSTVVTWTLWFAGGGEVDPDGDGMHDVQPGLSQLTVTLGDADPMEAAYSWALPGRVTTQVHGQPARFSSGHEGFSILTWDDGGRRYQLWGAATVEDAVRLAESVQPVALDDPRVVALLD